MNILLVFALCLQTTCQNRRRSERPRQFWRCSQCTRAHQSSTGRGRQGDAGVPSVTSFQWKPECPGKVSDIQEIL